MLRKYEKVQGLLPIIKERITQGKTQREIAAELGLQSKAVVKELLHRERVKERKRAAGIR